VRILRKDKFLWNGKIDSLKTGTLEVKELEWPTECGIKLVSNVKIELGDELEIYKMVKS
jgi:translation initiation factor IF-2